MEFKNFLNWGQKIILGSRKSAILGIIWTPGPICFTTTSEIHKISSLFSCSIPQLNTSQLPLDFSVISDLYKLV